MLILFDPSHVFRSSDLSCKLVIYTGPGIGSIPIGREAIPAGKMTVIPGVSHRRFKSFFLPRAVEIPELKFHGRREIFFQQQRQRNGENRRSHHVGKVMAV